MVGWGLMARVPVVSRCQTITAGMVLLELMGLALPATAVAAVAADLPASMVAMPVEQLAEPPGRAAGRARREGRAPLMQESQELLRAVVVVVLIQPCRAEIRKMAGRALRVGL